MFRYGRITREINLRIIHDIDEVSNQSLRLSHDVCHLISTEDIVFYRIAVDILQHNRHVLEDIHCS